MNAQELREVLSQPLNWRQHGIGFIKAYIDEAKTKRIHIYNKRFLTPGITLHHDHPWHLKSQILLGELTNTRYVRAGDIARQYETLNEGTISCLNFCGIQDTPKQTKLVAQPAEIYHAGAIYEQRASEIHKTEAADGTVTLVERLPYEEGDGTARVFWPVGTNYVNADLSYLTGEQVQFAIKEVIKSLGDL